MIWGLTRPELYATNELEGPEKENPAELAVVRNLTGPLGIIPLRFNNELTRFSDLPLDEGIPF